MRNKYQAIAQPLHAHMHACTHTQTGVPLISGAESKAHVMELKHLDYLVLAAERHDGVD